MLKRNGDESRKNFLDSIRLNPKCHYNGQPAPKLQIEERSTTIPLEGSTIQAFGIGSGSA